jgi:hypothetical protein
VWVKPSGIMVPVTELVSKQTEGQQANQFRLEVHRDGRISLAAPDMPGGYKHYSFPNCVSPDEANYCFALFSDTPLKPNVWTHVAVTYSGFNPSGAAYKIYMNGLLERTVKTVGTGVHHNNEDMLIGSVQGTFKGFFQGDIKRAVYYMTEMSSELVKASMGTAPSAN